MLWLPWKAPKEKEEEVKKCNEWNGIIQAEYADVLTIYMDFDVSARRPLEA